MDKDLLHDAIELTSTQLKVNVAAGSTDKSKITDMVKKSDVMKLVDWYYAELEKRVSK